MRLFVSEKIVLDDYFHDGGILVENNGKILEIISRNDVESIIRSYEDMQIIDVGNYVIMSGIIDSHVHVNEPGRTDWEGFRTATKAAAAGGITTIVDMPLNSIPPTTTVENLKIKVIATEGKLHVDVAFWGGLIPGNEDELVAMVNAGVVGFKCFLCPSGVEEFSHVNFEDVEKALQKLELTNSVLAFHAELEEEVPLIVSNGDPTCYETFLETRPSSMETRAIEKVIELSGKYNRKSTAQPSIPALKRNNSQSSIPLLRRSNSQTSIQQRQSRSSVRGPSQGGLRARSLAVKSPLTCSNLQVPNYGSGLIRSRSTSNVRYTTPQRERREISPYSVQRRLHSASSCSSGTKDLRPINDKDWQRLQLIRVKSFLCELDPSLPSVKPLSIAVFINIMNLLLKEFDSRITITTDNYKDEVIKYLKTFSYPGIIKPSLIKNISAPHEFPKVLAIFSWLIDRIEFIRNPDKVIRPVREIQENVDLYHMLLSYSIQKFKLWNQNKEAGADEQLRDELYAYYNIESLNVEEKRKELEILKAKAASLQEIKLKLDSKEKETEQLQKDIERAKVLKEEYIKQKELFAQVSNVEKEEKLRRIECVKKLIQMEEDMRKDIQNILDAQIYDHVEKDNLNKKVQELNHTIKLNQDRIDAQAKSISNYDEMILTTKLKLEEKIHKYNNDISKLSLLNRNLNELKIPETDFMESTFLDVLNKTIEKKNKWMEKFQAEFKEKQKQYGKISSENKKALLDIDDVTNALDKKNTKIEDLKEQLDKLNYTKKNEINRKQLHLDELNKNLADQKAETEKKIEGCKKRMQDAESELAEHKDSVKRHCELSKDFFKNIANSIFQTIAKQSEQRESIANVLIEASSTNVISESTAACLGIDLPSEVEPMERENKNL